MEYSKLYQIMLSVLDQEATSDECRLFETWLSESDSNREEFEKVKYLHQLSTINRKEKIYGLEQALKIVNKKIEKKITRKISYSWIKYTAILLTILSVGVLLKINYSIKKDIHLSDIKVEDYTQPTLFLDNGEIIDLTKESFSIEQSQVKVQNEADKFLSYELNDLEKNTKISNNRLVIPKGQTYELQLSDGSRVWMNSESELIYPTKFVGDTREVTLIGEAYFKVAENKNIPFYVKTERMNVKVLGTSFNVCCYPKENDIKTTLVEGSVAISLDLDEYQTIKPSEQYIYNKELKRANVNVVDTEIYTSWINGRYIFKNVPLSEIVTKLQHWYDFEVIYEDEILKKKTYSLIIDRENSIDILLDVISFTSDVKLVKNGQSINIFKQRR